MTRMRMLLVSSTLALAALLLAPSSAHADTFSLTTGYPCSMGGGWNNTSLNGVGTTGPGGYAWVSLTSQPSCAGSFQGTVYLLTTGATTCQNELIPAELFQTMIRTVYNALAQGLKLQFSTGTPTGGVPCAASFWLGH
jgi:hypothetical protein